MQRLTTSKVSKKDFTNVHNGIDLVSVAQDHIRYVAFWLFKERIERGVTCQNLKRLLEILCMLYGLTQLQKNATPCFETGYFSAGGNFSENILLAIK